MLLHYVAIVTLLKIIVGQRYLTGWTGFCAVGLRRILVELLDTERTVQLICTRGALTSLS